MYCCICGKMINASCTCDDCKSALKNKKKIVLSLDENAPDELDDTLKSMDELSQSVAQDIKLTSFNHVVDSKKYSTQTLDHEPRTFFWGSYPYKYARKKNLGVSIAGFLLTLIAIGLAIVSYFISKNSPSDYLGAAFVMMGSIFPFCIAIALAADSFASFKVAGIQGRPRPIAAFIISIVTVLSLVVAAIMYVWTFVICPMILSILGIVSFALIIIVYLFSSRQF